MDENEIGKAIAFLRKRCRYTQKDLANRIGISDKAVSKWERGIGLPDIGYLRKLAILLDTDTDSLLAGDVVHHDIGWHGVLVLENNSHGIDAGTIIYDKPLINYLLCYFMLVGIKEIVVVCSEKDRLFINSELGDGSKFGIKLYIYSGNLRKLLEVTSWDKGNIMMVYGRCLLYGVDQTRFFQKAMVDKEHFTMLVLPKKYMNHEEHVYMDKDKRVISFDSDAQLRTQYDFCDIPILFFPIEIFKEICEFDNIKEYITKYSVERAMYVQVLDRGFVEIEIDSWENVQEASTFIKIVQDRCGMNVYCIEEVAWRRGFINIEQLRTLGELHNNIECGKYIIDLCDRIQKK